MEEDMEKALKSRFELVSSYFDEEAWGFIFDEHSYVEKIVFFGSFMKGKNTAQSDIDMIMVPSDSFIKETDDEDKICCLFGLHEDVTSQLKKGIALDVKLQELTENGHQIGISYHSHDLVCGDYGFEKGQIGLCAVVDREQTVTYQTL